VSNNRSAAASVSRSATSWALAAVSDSSAGAGIGLSCIVDHGVDRAGCGGIGGDVARRLNEERIARRGVGE
jgi:hypothetical protein